MQGPILFCFIYSIQSNCTPSDGRKQKAGVALECDTEVNCQFVCDQRTSLKINTTYRSHLKMFVDYMAQKFPH